MPLCASQAPNEIASILGLSRDLVCRLKDYYYFEGPEEEREAFFVNRKRREAPRRVRDGDFVATVKVKVEEYPGYPCAPSGASSVCRPGP